MFIRKWRVDFVHGSTSSRQLLLRYPTSCIHVVDQERNQHLTVRPEPVEGLIRGSLT